MDGARFDDLARRLPGFIDRRSLLRQVATALGATTLGLTVLALETEAGKKRRKKRRRCFKKANRTWCGKKCVRGECCPDKPCGDESCACLRAIEGDFYCAAGGLVVCDEGLCANSGECEAGNRCIRVSTPEVTCCRPECDAM